MLEVYVAVAAATIAFVFSTVGSTTRESRSPGYRAIVALSNAPHPPDWVFGTVWAVLYVHIVIATYLFVRHYNYDDGGDNVGAEWGVRHGPALLVINVALNKLWPAVFFYGMMSTMTVRRIASWLALFLLIAIVGTAVAVTGAFMATRHPGRDADPTKYPGADAVAAWPLLLWMPYLVWLVFATYLNAKFALTTLRYESDEVAKDALQQRRDAVLRKLQADCAKFTETTATTTSFYDEWDADTPENALDGNYEVLRVPAFDAS